MLLLLVLLMMVGLVRGLLYHLGRMGIVRFLKNRLLNQADRWSLHAIYLF